MMMIIFKGIEENGIIAWNEHVQIVGFYLFIQTTNSQSVIMRMITPSNSLQFSYHENIMKTGDGVIRNLREMTHFCTNTWRNKIFEEHMYE